MNKKQVFFLEFVFSSKLQVTYTIALLHFQILSNLCKEIFKWHVSAMEAPHQLLPFGHLKLIANSKPNSTSILGPLFPILFYTCTF